MRKYAILATIFVVTLLSGCSKLEILENEDDYGLYVEDVTNSNYLMPELDELGDYSNYETVYFLSSMGAYETISLIVKYTEDEYLKQKDIALNKLNFVQEQTRLSDNYIIIMEPQFEYKGYTISVVDDERFEYICNYGMFGYDDDRFELVFLYVNSPEICSNKKENMTEYMDELFVLE